jgi:hypothetical protein
MDNYEQDDIPFRSWMPVSTILNPGIMRAPMGEHIAACGLSDLLMASAAAAVEGMAFTGVEG